MSVLEESDVYSKDNKKKKIKKMYVAYRLLLTETNKVRYSSIKSVKDFKKDDYDKNPSKPVYIKNGKDDNGKNIFEPATILALSDDIEKLQNPEKRYPFPKKRRSDIIQELANYAEGEQSENLVKTKKLKTTSISKKVKENPADDETTEYNINNKLNVLKQQHLIFSREHDNNHTEISVQTKDLQPEPSTSKRWNTTKIAKTTSNCTKSNKRIKQDIATVTEEQSPSSSTSNNAIHQSNSEDTDVQEAHGSNVLTVNKEKSSRFKKSNKRIKQDIATVTEEQSPLSSTSNNAIHQSNSEDTDVQEAHESNVLTVNKEKSSRFKKSNKRIKKDIATVPEEQSCLSSTSNHEIHQSNGEDTAVQEAHESNVLTANKEKSTRFKKLKMSTGDDTKSIDNVEKDIEILKKNEEIALLRAQINELQSLKSNITVKDSGLNTPSSFGPKTFRATAAGSTSPFVVTDPPLDDEAPISPLQTTPARSVLKKPHRLSSKSRTKKSTSEKWKQTKMYDSDDYQNSDGEKMDNMKTWNRTDEETGLSIKMIHLFYGISITYSAWKKAVKASSNSLFTAELAVGIWGTETLKKKALQPEKAKPLPDGTAREPLSPKKESVLKKCFCRRLKDQGVNLDLLKKKLRRQICNKYRTYLSKYINNLRESEKKELQLEEKNDD